MSKEQEQKIENGSVERRFFPTNTRAATGEGGRMEIGGYGAIFNTYTNMGWYAEVVMPGFFDGIKDDRCACLLNHEPSQVLGRIKNGTLTLKIDENGLDYQAVLPSSRNDVYDLVKEGYLYESSFAFTSLEAKWAEVDRSLLVGKLSDSDLDALSYGGKISVRYLEKGKELFDVSPVTYGAYEGTTTDTRIAKRSFEAWKEESGEKEKLPPATEVNQRDEHRKRLLTILERNQ